ncbi:hypothetical protein pb186bvf_014843 [Paramecium bursaria]
MNHKQQYDQFKSGVEQIKYQANEIQQEKKQKQRDNTKSPEQQIEDQRSINSLKYSPYAQNIHKNTEKKQQRQNLNFEFQNHEPQQPKKRRIDDQQNTLNQNLEIRILDIVAKKIEDMKKINLLEGLNMLKKINDDLRSEIQKEFKRYNNISEQNKMTEHIREQRNQNQVQDRLGTFDNPFNHFEELSGVQMSNNYYLKFEDTCLSLFVNVSDKGRWLRLWFKSGQKVFKMVEDSYVSKNFANKIMEHLQCIGISTDRFEINTEENWLVDQLTLSCQSKSALTKIDMILNLLNGKTPNGNDYEKAQNGCYLILTGNFDSFTLQNIECLGYQQINKNQKIELQIGGSRNSVAQIINIKGEKFKQHLQNGDIQCYLSHQVTRAFWLKL